MRWKIFFIVLFIFAFFAFPGRSSAQGTYTCHVGYTTAPTCFAAIDNCEDDYSPGNSCDGLNINSCNDLEFTCIADGSDGANCGGYPFSECRSACNWPEAYAAPGGTCNVGVCCIVPQLISGVRNFRCSNTGEISTALGCIPFHPTAFLNAAAPWAVGLASGIAVILMIVASIQMALSSGDPKKVQAAKELLVSALAGLAVIALAVIIMNFVGVTLLNIPGFNQNPNL